jgi:hypothetical protein
MPMPRKQRADPSGRKARNKKTAGGLFFPS